MNDLISLIRNQIVLHGVVYMVANVIVILCTFLVLFAILIDFVMYHQPNASKKKLNSWVETGSMFAYFFGYYLLMHIKTGRFVIVPKYGMDLLLLLGTCLVMAGCFFNVKGRYVLKDNWANQVTLYHHHTFVTKSVYAFVRHPLYASLIWMLTGGALVYSSYFALLSILFIFIPMMYYRAKQEENLLSTEFPEYANYKQQVGMFFPNFLKHDNV